MLLLAGHFMQGLGWTSMLLLPMYLESIGADRSEIGRIMALGGVGGLLALPFAGLALDRLGRKVTLVTASLVTAFGVALLAVSPTMGPWLWVARFIAGVGTGTLFAGYFTFVSDFLPEARRTEGIALFGISGLLPLLINPFAEALVPNAQALRWVFPASCIGVLLSIPCLLAIHEPAREHQPVSRRGWLQAVTTRSLRPVWVANLTFASAVAVFMAFAAVAAQGAGMDRPARLWIPYALGAISVRLIGARLPDRVGPPNMVAPSLAFYSLGMLALTLVDSELGFLFAALLCGMGHGYCFPVIASQVVGRSAAHIRGGAMALSTGIWEASSIAAQPIFGAIAKHYGDAWCFITAASFCCLGLVVWLLLEAYATSDRWALPAAQNPAQPD